MDEVKKALAIFYAKSMRFASKGDYEKFWKRFVEKYGVPRANKENINKWISYNLDYGWDAIYLPIETDECVLVCIWGEDQKKNSVFYAKKNLLENGKINFKEWKNAIIKRYTFLEWMKEVTRR